ncbi:hypothetical protein BH11BAC7_BH11BAC7_26330 [soil metagenome]
MASVNFYLKGAFSKDRLREIKDKKLVDDILETQCQIFLKLSTGGERFQIYTKKRIKQKLWDVEKQEVDANKIRSIGVAFNKWLRELRQDVLKLATENELAGKRTSKKDLHDILSARFLNKPKSEEFEEQLKQFLSQHKTSAGHSLRPTSLEKYQGLKKHLTRFAKHTHRALNVKNFDKEFFQDFKDYLITEKGLNDNTVSKYLKVAKPLIRYYMGKGVIAPYLLTDIKSHERHGEIFVLPIKTILDLQNLKLEEDHLKEVRDIFCFMCWTGQRYSDYGVLTTKDITINEHGEKVWKLVTIKTQTAVTVPIIPYAQEILNRYKKSIFPIPRLTNPIMNQHLKELGQAAKLDYSVKLVAYYDGKKKEEFVPFYEVLTTHVARKSFITNSLILGVPERVIREVSGHRSEISFRRYVNLAENYKSDMITKAFSKENVERLIKQSIKKRSNGNSRKKKAA